MYQFHGWFVLSDSTAEHFQVRQLSALNGDYFLFVAGAGNRPRDTPAHLDRLLDRRGRPVLLAVRRDRRGPGG